MKAHTKSAFDLLTIAYPTWGERFDAAGIEEWGQMLEDIPADALRQAILRIVRANRFAPSVAEIYSAAGVRVDPVEDEFADLRREGLL